MGLNVSGAVFEAGAGGAGDAISRPRCDAASRSLPAVGSILGSYKKGLWPAAEVRRGLDRPGRDALCRPGAGVPGSSLSTARLAAEKYKTFLATYKRVGGVIRVVLAGRVRPLGGVLLDRTRI